MGDDEAIFEKVIRLDEKTKYAHERLDRHEAVYSAISGRIESLESAMNKLNVAVARLNVRVGLAAALGSLVGGALISVLVAYVLK